MKEIAKQFPLGILEKFVFPVVVVVVVAVVVRHRVVCVIFDFDSNAIRIISKSFITFSEHSSKRVESGKELFEFYSGQLWSTMANWGFNNAFHFTFLPG